MRAGAIHYVADVQRRISGVAHFVLRRIRLSAIYISLVIILAVAWGASSLGSRHEPANTPKSPAAVSTPAPAAPTPDPTETGGSSSMSAATPDANNSNSSSTSVRATDDGTTVTINGNSATIPLNQPFQQSYDTDMNGTTMHTDVSVENNTSESGRSVTLHMQSQSQSSVSESTGGGQ